VDERVAQGDLRDRRGVGGTDGAAGAAPAGRHRRREAAGEIQLERIAATLEAERPEIAVIDSIQTLFSEALTSAPGSVAQVRECAAQLTRVAKGHGIALVFIGM